MKNKISVLIVTYNRLEKLKKCLEAYSKQTYLPFMIYIVDNNSSDGTKEFLKEWYNLKEGFSKEILLLDSNVGGSGGFYEGMKAVMNFDFDWLWISDDDAYPEKNAFYNTNEAINNLKCDVICSTVNTEEGIDQGHRKIVTEESFSTFGYPAPIENYKKDSFPISIFSFVGTCIKKEVIDSCGFPIRDFFIWFDDTEYSMRVNEKYKILCVPQISVFHDTIIEKEWKYSWKTYYGERNKLRSMQLHMSKSSFRKYMIRYCLGMMKHYFTDYNYYSNHIDGDRDFKKGVGGVSEKHTPGRKPAFKNI